MIANLLTIAGLLACSVLGAPRAISRVTCPQAANSGITRGCDGSMYFVCSGGMETLYKCDEGCTIDSAGQPRCNNGVISSVPALVPIPVVPIS